MNAHRARGTGLLEVLITLFVFAIGVPGMIEAREKWEPQRR